MIEIHPEIKTMGIEDKKEENKLVYLVEEETQKLIKWVKNIEKSDDLTIFEKNQEIVTRLGTHYRSDGLTEIGFWTPKLMREVLHPKDIYLEIFTPLEKKLIGVNLLKILNLGEIASVWRDMIFTFGE